MYTTNKYTSDAVLLYYCTKRTPGAQYPNNVYTEACVAGAKGVRNSHVPPSPAHAARRLTSDSFTATHAKAAGMAISLLPPTRIPSTPLSMPTITLRMPEEPAAAAVAEAVAAAVAIAVAGVRGSGGGGKR